MEQFQQDHHLIVWGDVIESLSEKVANDSVDLIFTDPPYNIGKNFNGRPDSWHTEADYLQWCYRWLDLCIQKLRHNGSLYIMASTQSMPYLDIYLRDKLHILSRIVWHYDSSGVQAKKYYGSLYEPILFCVKDDKNYIFNASDIMVEAKTGAKRKLIDYRKPIPTQYHTEKVPGNVWQFPRVRYRMDEYENHPTQKPELLLERIIRASSNPGSVVLDPFAGTFTTAFVAKKLGRRTVSIEIEEEYIKIGLRRLQFQTHFNGVELKREPRSYEKQPNTEAQLRLFEHS